MTLIATGKSGTIGRHLSANVLSANFRNLASISETLKREPGAVIVHLAGVVGPVPVSVDEDLAFRVNVSDSVSLAREAIAKRAKRFVFVSTGHVYGASDTACEETQDVNPTSAYAMQKLMAELELSKIFADESCELLIVRLFSILGLDCPSFTLGGRVAQNLRKGGNFVVPTSDDVRDFLSPLEAASALEKLAVLPDATGVLNLGSGYEETVGEAVTRLVKTSGQPSVSFTLEGGHSKMPYLAPSLRKLTSLGFALPIRRCET